MRRRPDPLADPAAAVRRVYAYVAYRIGDGHEAEDVTSATIERAIRYRASFDPRKGDPNAWLIGIARTQIDESHRARALAPTVETAAEPWHGGFAEDSDRRLTIAGAVGRLEPRDRELIALRYGADLTARQIAEMLQVKTNAIEVRLHRLLAQLREIVEQPAGVAVPDPPPAPAQAQTPMPRAAPQPVLAPDLEPDPDPDPSPPVPPPAPSPAPMRAPDPEPDPARPPTPFSSNPSPFGSRLSAPDPAPTDRDDDAPWAPDRDRP